ncbi:MAG: SDR family oxidoreductase [Dehalococcoidia bacterium]|nr:SDR family oxidoreductase [Dehalococcoidia bacterium]
MDTISALAVASLDGKRSGHEEGRMSQLDKMSLEGKIAIVTGGGRGLGREMSLYMARAGADVAVAARTVSEIEAVAKEVRAIGRKALAIRTDVTSPQQVQAMVDQTIAELGHVDIMISNAGGGGSSKPIWDTDLEKDMAPALALDMYTHFYCAQSVLKHMVERQSGKIMFNGSAAFWNKGGRHGQIHSLAEGGTANLARSLAITFAQDNIQVNVLGTGLFLTQYLTGGRRRGDDTGAVAPRRPADMSAQFLAAKRRAEAWEEAPLVVFLASDASNYITGQIVYIDGGIQQCGFAPMNYAPTIPLTRR